MIYRHHLLGNVYQNLVELHVLGLELQVPQNCRYLIVGLRIAGTPKNIHIHQKLKVENFCESYTYIEESKNKME